MSGNALSIRELYDVIKFLGIADLGALLIRETQCDRYIVGAKISADMSMRLIQRVLL